MPLIQDFSQELLEELYRQSDILTGIPGRVRERWLYGMISRTLSKILSPNDAILTEISLNRLENNGRVDFIFTYRRFIYIMEFKVGFASFNADINGNKRVIRAWTNIDKNGVVDQIIQIRDNNESINKVKNIFNCSNVSNRPYPNGIRFLPVVIFGHQVTTNRGNEHLDKIIKNIEEEMFKSRHDQIKSIYENKYYGNIFSCYKNDFVYINNTINNKSLRATVGYSIFAGYPDSNEISF